MRPARASASASAPSAAPSGATAASASSAPNARTWVRAGLWATSWESPKLVVFSDERVPLELRWQARGLAHTQNRMVSAAAHRIVGAPQARKRGHQRGV